MNYISSKPELFLLLVPLVFAIYYSHFWGKRGGRLKLAVSIWGSDRFKPSQGFYSFSIFISTLFFWVAVVLVIIALTGPERVDKEKIYLKKGRDIIFVLDESPSMFAVDLGMSRFDAAKQAMLSFISERENDAIGLVSYSSNAVSRVSPTVDYGFLRRQIESLSVRDDKLGKGTDMGMAIAFACYHLKDCSSPNQIIILLTDGVNNSGRVTPLEAAEHASKMGIKIFPVAIGRLRGLSSLVIKDLSGNMIQGEIEGNRNDALLKKIAKVSGGSYYNSDSLSVLAENLNAISIEEPSNAESRIERDKTSFVQPLVLAALFLLLLNFIIRKLFLKEVL